MYYSMYMDTTHTTERTETMEATAETAAEKLARIQAAAKIRAKKRRAKQARREARELARPVRDTIVVTVTTIRQTAKAIKVQIVEDHTGRMSGWSGWLPLSQVDYQPRAMGPCDAVEIPNWLVDAKLAE